jgi:hypothetical protein
MSAISVIPAAIDAEGECNGYVYIRASSGLSTITVRCTRPKGHDGPHTFQFENNSGYNPAVTANPVSILWHQDERDWASRAREFFYNWAYEKGWVGTVNPRAGRHRVHSAEELVVKFAELHPQHAEHKNGIIRHSIEYSGYPYWYNQYDHLLEEARA